MAPHPAGRGGQVSETTEFGLPRTSPTPGGTLPRYGWLGTHQRDSSTPGGLTLMGVRLYSPVLGRFLTVDPVEGGSSNDYDYANADPINQLDLDGRISWKVVGKWSRSHMKRAWKGFRAAALSAANAANKYCGWIPTAVGVACSAVSLAGFAVNGRRRNARNAAFGLALGGVGSKLWTLYGRANAAAGRNGYGRVVSAAVWAHINGPRVAIDRMNN